MNSLTQALGKDIGESEAQKLKRVACAGLYCDRAVFRHTIQETVECPKRPSTLWCHFFVITRPLAHDGRPVLIPKLHLHGTALQRAPQRSEMWREQLSAQDQGRLPSRWDSRL